MMQGQQVLLFFDNRREVISYAAGDRVLSHYPWTSMIPSPAATLPYQETGCHGESVTADEIVSEAE